MAKLNANIAVWPNESFDILNSFILLPPPSFLLPPSSFLLPPSHLAFCPYPRARIALDEASHDHGWKGVRVLRVDGQVLANTKTSIVIGHSASQPRQIDIDAAWALKSLAGCPGCPGWDTGTPCLGFGYPGPRRRSEPGNSADESTNRRISRGSPHHFAGTFHTRGWVP
jgi:hypothetical protein